MCTFAFVGDGGLKYIGLDTRQSLKRRGELESRLSIFLEKSLIPTLQVVTVQLLVVECGTGRAGTWQVL